MKTTRIPFLACILAVTLLAGCTAKEVASVESIPQTTAAAVTEATIPATTVPEASEISTRLAETEAEHARLQDRLMLDSSLTQADMNELAGQEYTLWDTLLNDLWAELTHTLPKAQMQQLLEEERAWIRWKENSIAMAANYYDGGSLSVLAANFRAATVTRDRVYELAQILTTRQYPSPVDLYSQVFLPLTAQGQQLSYENLLLFLEFRGLSPQEEEGTFLITAPSCPGESVFGILSNESEVLTVPKLGYSTGTDTSQRSVRVDFYTESADRFIEAYGWDDGTPVATVQEMTEYLKDPA